MQTPPAQIASAKASVSKAALVAAELSASEPPATPAPAQADAGMAQSEREDVNRKPQAVQKTATVADEHEVRFRADTLVVTPVLNVGLVESQRTAAAGETVTFLGYNNYPSFVVKGEIRIFRATQSVDAEPLAVLPVDAAGGAGWTVPSTGPSALFYVYRVYSKDGKFDETSPEELTIVDTAVSQSMSRQPVERPNFGAIDEAARRTIDVSGLMATVTGHADPSSDTVFVSGQAVPVDLDGKFASQQIVSRKDGAMEVVIKRDGKIIKQAEQSFAVPKDDWFIVGQGDLTLGRSYDSGPLQDVAGDTLASGNYAAGRAAFYAKGIVGDDVRVTASLDTGETLVKDLFSNLDRKDPRQLLRRLNREQYYPTYGDDSTLVEDAPTQGRFYLRVAKDESQLVVGNFVTTVNGAELAQLDRGLFGALADYNSKQTTEFGERKVQVTAFASDPGTVPGREEFRGTGGSLYFLKRQDVSIGSERVRIEVRDRETGLVLESRDLFAQQDYDFDPFQGRITLLKPLASTVANGGVVREGASTGNVPVLVVRYEYSPLVGDLDGYTVGGRGSAWLGENLRLGMTVQRDTVEDAAQTLIGADAIFRLTAGTYLKAEIAQTDGPGFGQSNSVDGGLSFTDIASPGAGVKAQAWRTEAAVDFAELAGNAIDSGAASAYYESYDQGFASAGRLSPADTVRWGAAVNLPLGSAAAVTAKYDELSSGNTGDSKTGSLDLTNKFSMGTATLTAKAGLRYEDRTPGLLFNSVQDGSRTDAALELEYAPSKNLAVHAFGQATVGRDPSRQGNSRVGGGIKAQLTEQLSIAGELSGGDGGLGADIQLNHRLGDGREAYVGYSLFADRTDTGLDSQNIFTRSNRGSLTLGARQRFSDSLSVYGENRVGIGGVAPSLTRSFGLQFAPTEKLSFTGSFENGQIDDATTGLFKRTAVSMGVGYTADDVRIGSSIEMRHEDGQGRDVTVWLLRNDFSYSVNPSWTALGRLNIAQADFDSPSVKAAEFTEAMAGLAFRPVNNERFNALARFSYFEDLGPAGQITGSGQTQSPKQESTIISLDANYDLSKKLTIGGKYGYRSGRVSISRDSDTFVNSEAHLGVIRADYHVNKEWDVLLEGRALWVTLADDKRLGALGAIYRHLGNNVKVGVGYSFSDFSDDLTDQSYTSHGPFLNILGKF
ncbi:hypothetical protein [Pontixanthobacter gangjinensis]|uniref:Uncharacterized protein n=1 Tax=Pontixanthobacter gangjinensis TaxID=1028742 RepID=A0A6I4SPC3_9SPHN|nr:hypothetical protein [Pontixanthobacter gangjinensis]MXO57633.1 hypothetical protein [Pontixanthobacter gangjinensis]